MRFYEEHQIKIKFATYATILISVSCIYTGCKASSSSSATPTSQGGGTSGGGGSGGGTTTTGSFGAVAATDANGNSVASDAFGVLFVTTATTDATFGDPGNGTTDLTFKADPMCATQAGILGYTGTFKAVLSVGSRTPTSGWVLKPSTPYRRADLTTAIDTTNASGTFDFPLANAITAASTTVYTGMQSDWTPGNNCSGWTSNSGYPNIGALNLTSTTAINNGNSFSLDCSATLPILCTNILTKTVTVPAQASYRRIFATTSLLPASMGFTNENSVARFDSECQTEANAQGYSNGGYTHYKALVETDTTNAAITRRFACTTYGCPNGPGEGVGWILEVNREYRRADGITVIGTTNSGGVFDFPLTNSWTGVNEEYWTGANPGWAMNGNDSTESCEFFQDNSGTDGGHANVGYGDQTDSTSIDGTTARCNETHKILCVEQTRTQNVYVTQPGYN